jgi:hypothetical protein
MLLLVSLFMFIGVIYCSMCCFLCTAISYERTNRRLRTTTTVACQTGPLDEFHCVVVVSPENELSLAAT